MNGKSSYSNRNNKYQDTVKIPNNEHPELVDWNTDERHSQTVGERGPVLRHDAVLHENLEVFVNSKGIERAVHVKGFGAFGYFQPFQSMRPYTKLSFLQNPMQQTPVVTRFSLAVSTKGTADSSRNVRGFSTKFYTDEGIFDLLCNHIPVFLVKDAMRFPDSIKSFLPSPINNLSYAERFWSFVANSPEATHFVTWLYSDLGTIKSLRKIRAYGVNTYIWKNHEGVRRYVKYHWIPLAGEECIDRFEAVKLAGEDPDVAGRDLYNTIQKGNAVEYDLCVQMMNIEDEECLPFDPLDDTKTWDEEKYPLMPVGRLVLNRNPDDYDSQIEKVAFSPANLLDGVELSNDKMLQGRSTIYWDAQRRRLGPDFRSIPINNQKDFNSSALVTSQNGVFTEGVQIRSGIPKEDNYAQAGQHYEALSDVQKEHLIDNIASELYTVTAGTQKQVLNHFCKASEEFGSQVFDKMKDYEKRSKN